MKKRIFTALLSVMMILTLITPAHGAYRSVGMVTVSDIESLLQAIDQANDGDTIFIDNTIVVRAETGNLFIGDADKHITLMRADGFNGGLFYVADVGNNHTLFNNLTIDGNSIMAHSSAITINGIARFDNVNFINHITVSQGAAIQILRTTVRFQNCYFSNNQALDGGHIRVEPNGGIYMHSSTLYPLNQKTAHQSIIKTIETR